VSFTLRYRCDADSGPFSSVATARGTGTNSSKMVTSDAHAGGATVSIPCPTLSPPAPEPAISLTQAAGPIATIGPDEFEIPIAITIDNTGTDSLSAVQIIDNLDIFGANATLVSVTNLQSPSLGINAGFDGLGVTDLLLGADALAPGGSGELSFTLRYRCDADSGPFTSVATALGTGITGGQSVASDAAAAGATLLIPCPTLPPPGFEPAVSLTQTVGDVAAVGPSEFEIPISIRVENTGNEPLNSVQIGDDLDIFGTDGALIAIGGLISADLSVDPAFDGLNLTSLLTGLDSLAPGGTGVVSFRLRYRCDVDSGAFTSVAAAQGTGLSTGQTVTSDSTAPGATVQIACLALAPPVPVPAISLTQTAGDVVALGPDEFEIPILITIENTGTDALDAVQMMDDLDIFGANANLISINGLASADLSVDPAFDGLNISSLLAGTDSLAPGATGSAAFTLRYRCDAGSGPFTSVATAQATGAASGQTVTSDAAAAAATVLITCPTLAPPVIESAIALTQTAGTPMIFAADQFEIPMTIAIENTGSDPLDSVQIIDNLDIFGANASLVSIANLAGSSLTVDPNFNGLSLNTLLTGSDSLPPGSIGTVTFTLRYRCEFGSGTFTSAATAQGTGAQSGQTVTSDAISANAGIAVECLTPDPGPVSGFQLFLTKTADRSIASAGDAIGYVISVENTSNTNAQGVTVTDFLPAGFSLIGTSAVLVAPGADDRFDTADDQASSILTTGNRAFAPFDLLPNETIRIRYVARIGTGVVAGDYRNSAMALINGTPESNVGIAIVTVVADPIFSQATILGKVFRDQNHNGWQDTAEATGITVSGGMFGCGQAWPESLPGRSDPGEAARTLIIAPQARSGERSPPSVRAGTGKLAGAESRRTPRWVKS
jgi:uncharacterized repeat protein (TIGR01451 family)